MNSFTGEEAEGMRGIDPDCATRDLFDSIAAGDSPAWRVEARIMIPEQAKTFRQDRVKATAG